MLNSNSGFEEIQSYLNKIYENGFLARDKWINYTLYNYIKETEIVAAESGWFDAYKVVLNAPIDIKNQRKYIQLLSSCKGNYIVTIHNEFADLFNDNKLSEAESIILAGLANFPDDKTLKSDLQMIQNKK
jgi:hypothetical protein